MKPTLPGKYFIRWRNSNMFYEEEISYWRDELCIHDYETGPCPLKMLPDDTFQEIITYDRFQTLKHILAPK